MPLFESPADAQFAQTISDLAYCNPFLPERIEHERVALGEQFVDGDVVWNVTHDWDGNRPNIRVLQAKSEAVAARARERLVSGEAGPSGKELGWYEDLCVYLLYYRVHAPFKAVVDGPVGKAQQQELVGVYETFEEVARHFLQIPGVKMPSAYEPHHLFALYFQVRRAFYHIFHNIVGSSMASAKLRAGVWQSIFTHDLHRYRSVL